MKMGLLWRAGARERWRELCSPFPNLAAEEVFAELVQAYCEPHRAYHNLDHVQHCLAEFDLVRDLAENPAALELAIWFHDGIYRVWSTKNEIRSARWAADELGRGGAPPEMAHQVARLVLATRHQATPASRDEQLMVDIDLAILGQPQYRFDKYERQIRQEFRWFPTALYRRRRIAVLEGFLARNSVFATVPFQDRYEARSRENIRRSLAALADPNPSAVR